MMFSKLSDIRRRLHETRNDVLFCQEITAPCIFFHCRRDKTKFRFGVDQFEMTTCVAGFKLLSKKLQKHGKIMPIYDSLILEDNSFIQKYFFLQLKMYNLLLVSFESTDR